jgi:hypothetical protein
MVQHKFDLRLSPLIATQYQEIAIAENRYWFAELEFGLGIWQGKFQAAAGHWLHWYNVKNNWIPTLAELAQQEKQRADKLAKRLRSLGIDPDQT